MGRSTQSDLFTFGRGAGLRYDPSYNLGYVCVPDCVRQAHINKGRLLQQEASKGTLAKKNWGDRHGSTNQRFCCSSTIPCTWLFLLSAILMKNCLTIITYRGTMQKVAQSMQLS